MEKKMKEIQRKLKLDIAFILIMGVVFLYAGGSLVYDVIAYSKVPVSDYEVKMQDGKNSSILYVEGEETVYVDYSEYWRVIDGEKHESYKTYAKYIYLGSLVKDLIRCIFMGLTLFCIYMIFHKIEKGESPFQKSSVRYLRIAGIILFCEGLIACVAEFLVIIIGVDEIMIHLVIYQQDIFLIVFGVIVAMISEIFKYGCDLQEDSDLIA